MKEKAFEWVAKIIETSNSDFHFKAIDNLIELHYTSFADEKMKTELELLKVRKWNEIHVILA